MLKKSLEGRKVVIKSRHYPYHTSKTLSEREALIGIGGNIGDVVRRLEHLFIFFNRSKLVHITETSAILKNPPFGYLEQADFYNAVIRIETHLTPGALLRYILNVEKKFGRKRLFKDGPRTLDIDILFYEDVAMDTDTLKIPHPGWRDRESVLIPLSTMKGLK